MSLTPHKLMMGLRAAGLLGAVVAAALLAGPIKYRDLGLPFPDTVAHALLFYGLGLLMLGALPRSRSSDLARALVGLAVASEMAQALVGREMSLGDFAGDMAGVALVVGPNLIGRFRVLAREHPHLTFAQLRRMDRRRAQPARAAVLDLPRL